MDACVFVKKNFIVLSILFRYGQFGSQLLQLQEPLWWVDNEIHTNEPLECVLIKVFLMRL